MAWGAWQWVISSTGRATALDKADPAFHGLFGYPGSYGRRVQISKNPCVPMEVGKEGFTGVCEANTPHRQPRGASSYDNKQTNRVCLLSKTSHDVSNNSDVELRMKNPLQWNGKLTISSRACTGFFVNCELRARAASNLSSVVHWQSNGPSS